MKVDKWLHLGAILVLTICVVGFSGCAAGGSGGGGGEGEGEGEGEAGELAANFDDAAGGNFAVAEDEAGNEYAFRDRGDGSISEGNIRFTDGTTVKASLDAEGRPVKFRSSTGENADVVYNDEGARIRYLASGEDPEDQDAYDDVSGVDTTAAKARVLARRQAAQDKRAVAMQGNESADTSRLREGFETFEEVNDSIFDEEANPDNPMRGTKLEEAAQRLARLASTTDIQEVDREVIVEVTIDEVPSLIEQLAGRTFVLFEAEGFCVEESGLENRLTFDEFGVLLTEFDRNFIFPDFSLGGGNAGFDINYATGSSVDLTRGQDVGFLADVAPVFTGTQLDGAGMITMERRFLAEIEFEVELFTTTTATTEQLFNAAFINGELNGDVLEFDLILVDLQEETPVAELGRVRYYDQNTLPPDERLFPCDVVTGEETGEGLTCPEPPQATVGREFEVSFASRDRDRVFDYDWFVSEGGGFVKNPSDPVASVMPTENGLLTVSLIVSDLSVTPQVFEYYACQIEVGDIQGDAGAIICPTELAIGEWGYFALGEGFNFDAYWGYEPFVWGTSEYEADIDTNAGEALIKFWEPGRFEVGVWAWGYDDLGDYFEEYFFCEVQVGGGEEDFCEAWGWYDDGWCDECPLPDPDCDEDWCELSGWYGDGWCDECPLPDPDCEEDWCEQYGAYGDGWCDYGCPQPDPDCEESEDWCDELGWYGDGWCDECPLPDPDCEADWCDELGWYGDGWCDHDCPQPDPDCDTNGFDTDGFDTDGFGTDGFGTDGFGTDGFGTDGFGTDGIETDGLSV